MLRLSFHLTTHDSPAVEPTHVVETIHAAETIRFVELTHSVKTVHAVEINHSVMATHSVETIYSDETTHTAETINVLIHGIKKTHADHNGKIGVHSLSIAHQLAQLQACQP
ncbi:hypothetical protein J6590_012633 [Homalodisca vitripennis]|nr:hypothetical protein J6590_012633 [Homalodisca vitripennis]